MPDLFDRAALLKAEKLTRLSLPAEALNHRAWCDPAMCCLIPFDGGTMAEACAIHQRTFNTSYKGVTVSATVSELVSASATTLEREPTVSFSTESGGEPPISVITPLLERCVNALSETIPPGARGTIDPLTFIDQPPFGLDDEAGFLNHEI